MENQASAIGNLYPSLTEAELKEAEENLEQYLSLIVCIYQRWQNQDFEQ